MENFDIYRDISERTSGDIYIGCVGPVRTGKSTFIKRFMDLLIIPNIDNEYHRERTKDELPQSASGKTIMTTEPKFIPNEAVEITMNENVRFKARMIDCVGYMIPEAVGATEGDEPRMVNTPWSEDRIPFTQAAEIGTKKVITDHSTIGIVITDGSITDIARESYIDAENRVINELKEIDKPFIIILNSLHPYSKETEELRNDLAQKHDVPVLALNVAQLKAEDINAILEEVLYEFPIREIGFSLPKWAEALQSSHWLKESLISSVKGIMDKVTRLRELKNITPGLSENENIKKAYIEKISLGEGCANIEINLKDNLFYTILSETTDMEIESEYQLISTIKLLSEAKKQYDKIKYALEEVKSKGYGMVTPSLEEMELEKPEIVKHGSRYGIKIKANAPSFHLIKADIETEVSPIVGTEEQSKELVEYLNEQYENDKNEIWNYNIFGKSLSDLITDGMQSKLYNMPEDAQVKFQETLQKIINEGSGGLICIIL